MRPQCPAMSAPRRARARLDGVAAHGQPAARRSTCCARRGDGRRSPRPSSPGSPGWRRPRSPTSCASWPPPAWSTPSPAAADAAPRSGWPAAPASWSGIDFGHSHVAVAVGDLTGALLAERREPLDSGHLATTTASTLAVDAAGRAAGRAGRIAPTTCAPSGWACPPRSPTASSDPRRSCPAGSASTPQAAARSGFGVPVHVENDANLGALAEHRRRRRRAATTASVFVKVSSGVGAGHHHQRPALPRQPGTAGEIGHLTLDEKGPMCRCGSRGCLEAYASTGALAGDDGRPAARTPTIDDIVEAAADGNVAALARARGRRPAPGLGAGQRRQPAQPRRSSSSAATWPGPASCCSSSARIGLRRHALDAVAATPVVAAELGERASLVGAVLLAAERTELVSD